MKRRSNPFSNLLTDDELVFLTKVLPSFRSDGECGADFQWSVRQVREQPAIWVASGHRSVGPQPQAAYGCGGGGWWCSNGPHGLYAVEGTAGRSYGAGLLMRSICQVLTDPACVDPTKEAKRKKQKTKMSMGLRIAS